MPFLLPDLEVLQELFGRDLVQEHKVLHANFGLCRHIILLYPIPRFMLEEYLYSIGGLLLLLQLLLLFGVSCRRFYIFFCNIPFAESHTDHQHTPGSNLILQIHPVCHIHGLYRQIIARTLHSRWITEDIGYLIHRGFTQLKDIVAILFD